MSTSLIFFEIGILQYAVEVVDVLSIIETPVSLVDISIKHDSIIGGINFNNQVIPLLDLKYFFGFNETSKANNTLILKSDDNILSIGVDKLVSVENCTVDEISKFDKTHLSYFSLVSGVHTKTGTQVIDVKALFESEDIMKIEYKKYVKEVKNFAEKTYLKFQLKEKDLYVSVSNVFKIIPRPDRYTRTKKSEFIDGTIEVEGKYIPLLSKKLVLGDVKLESTLFEESEYILILQKDDKKICLPIESFKKIENLSDLKHDANIISRADEVYEIVSNDEESFMFLRVDKIFSHDEITFSLKYIELEFGNESADEQNKVQIGTNSIMLFSVNQIFGIDLKLVQEIIELPRDVLRPPTLDDKFYGIYNLRGKIVHLVNSEKYYNLDQGNSKESKKKVIITLREGLYIGIIVNQLVGIKSQKEIEIMDIPSLVLNQYSEPLKSEVNKTFKIDEKEYVFIFNSEKFLNSLNV